MIQGLKVTVTGAELKKLCAERAEFHATKAAGYQSNLTSLEAFNVEGTSLRPGEAAKQKIEAHKAQAAELAFIGDHIDVNETYLLDGSDLHKLGITYRGFWFYEIL